MDDNSLAPVFPAYADADWRGLVDKVLKGGDFDRKLVTQTPEGIAIQPLYGKAQGDTPRALRAAEGPWTVMQRVDHPDPAEANRLALADLEGGASGLALLFAGAPAARGDGVRIETLADLSKTLDDVLLDLVRLRIETAPFMGRHVAALLAAHVDAARLSADAVTIDFGLDPIGDMVRTGTAPLPAEALHDRLGETVRDLMARGFKRTLVRVDARAVHEAGGSQVDELAYALATGVHYLRALEARGLSLEAARDVVSVLLPADDDQFTTIAKFRAMRLLWAKVEDACGLAPQPLHVAAETSWRMTTRRDPWVNMLRVTVAAFAAGLGGADSVTVLPLTAALGLPDGFARRMARNTQLILLEEANLWRVADPAAGAGGIETLTDELAGRAWQAFQAIEASGGIVAALTAGDVQAAVAKTHAAREKAIAQRKLQITGTNEFPNVHEAPVEVLTPPAAAATAHGERIAPSGPFPDLMARARAGAALPEGFARVATPVFAALPSHRDGEAFEALRDASDARLADRGSRPQVFLANLGKIASFTVRATFAKNAFETGGIEALSNDGFASHEDMAAAFKASGARLVCLCSSDDVYADEAVAAAQALKAAGASEIYLAGRPGDLEAALKDVGVTRFIYAGADLVATLREAMEHA